MPGTSVRMRVNSCRTLVTAMDAAHLTNPSTRGIMLASTTQGADHEIYLKTLSVCAGTETSDA